MDTLKYLQKHGVLENLDETTIRKFFIETSVKFLENKLDTKIYSQLMGELLYTHIYPKSITIKSLNLINLLEKAADISYLKDIDLLRKDLRKYISHG